LNINLASNDLSRGKTHEGFERLVEIQQIFPTTTLVLRTLAHWEGSHGRLHDALTHGEQAIMLEPGEPTNLASLASLLLQLGELDMARRLLDRGIEVGPENMLVQMTRSEYLWRTKRYDELSQLAQGMLERTGDQLIAGKEAAMPEFWLGLAAVASGDGVGALEHLGFVQQDLSELPPSFAVEVLTWAALARRMVGDDEAAVELVGDAARRMAALRLQGYQLAHTAYMDAVVAALEGDQPAAVEHFMTAVERGWFDAWTAANDPRLKSIHADPDFAGQLSEIRGRNREVLASVGDRFLAMR
jgi:tetratricopeptide (TPR) repeat protein